MITPEQLNTVKAQERPALAAHCVSVIETELTERWAPGKAVNLNLKVDAELVRLINQELAKSGWIVVSFTGKFVSVMSKSDYAHQRRVMASIYSI